MTTQLTETLKQIAADLSSDVVSVREIQGKLYVTTQYTKPSEWAANVEKVRQIAKVAQDRIGRESTREKAAVGGFWNMGHFCKERVTMVVRVKLTEAEHTSVLLGGNP
jgi:hypothetical protein